jgi:hypothetical protein
METEHSSVTSELAYKRTQCHNPVDLNLKGVRLLKYGSEMEN